MNMFREKLVETYYGLKDHDRPEGFFHEIRGNGFSVLLKMDGHELEVDSWRQNFISSDLDFNDGDYDGPYLECFRTRNHRLKRKFILFQRTVQRREKEPMKSWILECLGILLKDIAVLEPLGYRPTGFGTFTRNDVVSLIRTDNKIKIWKGKISLERTIFDQLDQKTIKDDDILQAVVGFEKEHPENFPSMNETLRDLMVSL